MRALRLLGVAAVLATPVLVHVALATGRGMPAALGLVGAELAVAAWVALRRWRWRWRWLGLGLAVVLGVAALGAAALRAGPGDVLRMQAGLSHAGIHGGLLLLFGRSLRPGRVPLVTMLALRVTGRLAPGQADYTRHVTQAWCVFCGAQLGISAGLYLTAPVAVWSLFVNVLDLPLLCAMLLGEYAVRCWRFRHQPHGSLRDGIRAFMRREDPHAG